MSTDNSFLIGVRIPYTDNVFRSMNLVESLYDLGMRSFAFHVTDPNKFALPNEGLLEMIRKLPSDVNVRILSPPALTLFSSHPTVLKNSFSWVHIVLSAFESQSNVLSLILSLQVNKLDKDLSSYHRLDVFQNYRIPVIWNSLSKGVSLSCDLNVKYACSVFNGYDFKKDNFPSVVCFYEFDDYEKQIAHLCLEKQIPALLFIPPSESIKGKVELLYG